MWRVSTILAINGISVPPPTFNSRVRQQAMLAARERGKQVHAIAEAHMLGNMTARWPEYDGYVDGVIRWCLDERPQVLFVERRVVDRRRRVTARIDLGILVDGRPTVVDYKTGGKDAAHAIQVAGYQDQAQADPELKAMALRHHDEGWARGILLLPGNGKFKYLTERDFDPMDRYLFRSALALTCWKADHGRLDITDPERPDDDYDNLAAVEAAGVPHSDF